MRTLKKPNKSVKMMGAYSDSTPMFKVFNGPLFSSVILPLGRLLSVGFLITLTSCKETGVQGGNIQSPFKGPKQIQTLSPWAVRIRWELNPRFEAYKIYRKGVNAPIAQETFSQYVVDELQPGNSYEFAVTGLRSADQVEEGLENFQQVSTFERFDGLKSDGVTVVSSSRVDLVWSANSPEVTFNIYYKKKNEQWSLTEPQGSVVGDERFSVTALQGGEEYCFFVDASYLDGTNDLELTTENLDSKSVCAVTDTDMTNLPTISVGSAVPGRFPWFLSKGGDPNYTINIFRASDNLQVATTTGNDAFKSYIEMPVGTHQFYAEVLDINGGKARVEVINNNGGGTSKVRSLEGTDPVMPELLADGNGVQQLGSRVVSGDFNCDGLKDVAVSAPTASPTINLLHYDEQGAVIIYYNYDQEPFIDESGSLVDPDPALKTDVTPTTSATFPNPQLVYYPVTYFGRRLGRDLAVGNLNGDCFYDDGITTETNSCDNLYNTYAGTPNINNIKVCEDLVVSNSNNEVFALFGNSNVGLVTGSGATSYGTNELTCDPSSNSCRGARLTEPTAADFGKALAIGDYNNDGFDDLAVSATVAGNGKVFVYRGSNLGIFPSSADEDLADIEAISIPTGNLISSVNFVAGNDEGFGDAIASAFNSRSCPRGHPTYEYRPNAPSALEYGYDFGKCDDLVIGAPGRFSAQGSIFSCKATLATIAGPEPDKQLIESWTCYEQVPAELLGSDAEYGKSIVSSPNMNGYPLDSHIGTYPDITGAVFVGAPEAAVGGVGGAGKVYGYYITPEADNHDLGGLSGILGNTAGTHGVTAQNTIPCNSTNNNVITGALRHCEHQALFNSPPQLNARYGDRLSVVDDIQSISRGTPSLAVSAPYRDVVAPGPVTIANAGIVYVYRPDFSTFGTDTGMAVTQTQSTTDKDPTCLSNCTWYGGGVNPFGPSVVYPSGLNINANFGIGGVAGGDFDGDGTGDIVAGAPGLEANVAFNGSVYMFASQGSFASVVNTPTQTLQENISNELNYSFEMAKVIGDVNGDGYDDVVTKNKGPDKTELVLFYGSSNGLITNPAPSASPINLGPLLLSVTEDAGFGERFHRIGSVNGDAYDDILVTSSYASYIYYGSFGGLITGEPRISPSGNNPLQFARSWCGSSGGNCANLNNLMARVVTSPNTYSTENQGVAFGDFNEDGYSDFAVGALGSDPYPTDQLADLTANSLNGADNATNNGRTFVVYGGPSGVQTDRTTGYIQITDAGGTDTKDVVLQNPCTTASPPVCKTQMLINPDNETSQFGAAVQGLDSIETQFGENWDELLVGAPTGSGNDGRVYLYKGGSQGLSPVPIQTLAPKYANGRFGTMVSQVGDINDDDYPDIVISAPNDTLGHVYVFYGSVVEGQGAFSGSGVLASQDYWTANLDLNENFTDPETPLPQVFQPTNTLDADDFGWGISKAGDFNQDGYADIIVNSPGADYNNEVLKTQVGSAHIFFGSEFGLQVSQNPSLSPQCYPDTTSVCGAYQVFLPGSENYEYTYLTDSAAGDINGDSIVDIILGGLGRTHPSGKAFSVGTFYILY